MYSEPSPAECVAFLALPALTEACAESAPLMARPQLPIVLLSALFVARCMLQVLKFRNRVVNLSTRQRLRKGSWVLPTDFP